MIAMPPAYVELAVTSNFTFLRGASHPEELVETAAALGHAAMGLADHNSVAGVVRAHKAAKAAGLRLLVGARLVLADAPSLLCYPEDRAAWGRLCRLLTLGRRRAPKGDCHLTLADVQAHAEGQVLIAIPPETLDETFAATLARLAHAFPGALFLLLTALYRGDEARRLALLAALAARARIPVVAGNDVRMHDAGRRRLADVLTCIRERCTITKAGFRLAANAERHLKPAAEMARLFADYPHALAATTEIAARCRFSLDELRYEYPVDPVADGRTPQEELVRLTRLGATERYPSGVPAKVEAQIEHELALIHQLGFAPYFLTVHDIVRFARGRGILCQGRGSAANSAVCFCLGITAVDPARIDVLFERFVSAARDEPPDIDVDFEHERREEVIQYIYQKYGRRHAGMTASVICFRFRSALREVALAMGLTEDTITQLQTGFWRRHWHEVGAAELRALGLAPDDRTLRQVIELAGLLRGFPRHLSQHTGGMVITRSPLDEVVPIENAAMPERTVIAWDKGDLDALGILKIDILALGMLTAVRKAFHVIDRHYRRPLTLASVPAEDPAVYDMLCRGDSVGVFQVESRAQMSMLPRLKPRCFYDLVIEVAIVRPGPIQGDMVHPYLRRRAGLEVVDYPSPELRQVLEKTLGVPLFQEQAMKIAIVGAGFSATEADRLRRAMATFRRSGTIHGFAEAFIRGMTARGYTDDFARRCFRQIEGFADYGFPESHAASFALLVYVSAWLKCHYPAAFAAALLNSQPMGFYAPAQIIGDARRHGIAVRPVDINASDWDCTLEPLAAGEGMALRLGFRLIKGFAAADGAALVAARAGGYGSLADLARRAGLGRSALVKLAEADAFSSLGFDRRRALWAVHGLEQAPLPLFAALSREEPAAPLPPAPLGAEVAADYGALTLSLKAHPLALVRPRLAAERYLTAQALARCRHGALAASAGIVVTRQRPGSAKGVIFITLEDETGHANLIIWPQTFERFRAVVLRSAFLGCRGRVQRQGRVVHLLAHSLIALDPLLGRLKGDVAPTRAADEAKFDVVSRDFH
jgi:error-prone DNA polymerase